MDSQPASTHLKTRLSKVFDKYDEQKTGLVHKDKFAKIQSKTNPIEWKSNAEGLVSKADFIEATTAKAHQRASKLTGDNTPFTSLIGKSNAPSKNQVEVRVGNVTNAKTKVEIRYELNGGASDYFKSVKQSTPWADETVGVIIKIKSTKAKEGAEKLQEIINGALEMAGAMIPQAQDIIDHLKIEAKPEGDAIYLNIIVKDDADWKELLGVVGVIDSIFANHKSSVQVSVEAQHDFSNLLGESKTVSSLVADGLRVHAHLETDSTEVSQSIAESIIKKIGVRELSILTGIFLQKDFNLNFSIDELKVKEVCKSICGASCDDILDFDTGAVQQILPMVAAPAIEILKNPPMPIVAELHDFLKDFIDAHVSITVKTPALLVAFELKTGGVKDLYENLLLKA